MPGLDTKTRYQGVFARHRRHCRIAEGKPCSCNPSYYGVVWDRPQRRQRKTGRFDGAVEARDARADLRDAVRKGKVPRESGMRLDEARPKFVKDARDGVALNK